MSTESEATTKGASAFKDLAQATPSSRDRYVDLLRAFSICVVVLGHWLIAIIELKDGQVTGENALHVIPGLWIATWVLQVMPIFFFVGGFSNLVTITSLERKGHGYAEFVFGRTKRLMRPTALMLGIWIPVTIVVDLVTKVSDETIKLVGGVLTRPLWFIGIYLIMIALAPPMLRLHKGFGIKVPLAMIAGAVVIDVLAIGVGLETVAYINFAFVWMFVHQLGFFYADGSLTDMSKKRLTWMAILGLGALVAMTASGVYSASMVGLRAERSNTNPPTICIIALTLMQVGLAMLLRPTLSRWLQKVSVWAKVIALNAVIMTLFLWHQTAMLVTAATLLPLGFPQPQPGSGLWWGLRPVWVLVLAVVLGGFVAFFGRFERPRERSRKPDPGAKGAQEPEAIERPMVAVAGVVLVMIGILGFAVSGFDRFALGDGDPLVFLRVNPLQNVIALASGYLLLGISVARRRLIPSVALALVLVGMAVMGLFIADSYPARALALGSAAGVFYGLTAGLVLAGISRRDKKA